MKRTTNKRAKELLPAYSALKWTTIVVVRFFTMRCDFNRALSKTKINNSGLIEVTGLFCHALLKCDTNSFASKISF